MFIIKWRYSRYSSRRVSSPRLESVCGTPERAKSGDTRRDGPADPFRQHEQPQHLAHARKGREGALLPGGGAVVM